MQKSKLSTTALLLSVLLVVSILMSNVNAVTPTALTSADILHRQGNQLVNSLGHPVVLRGTTGDFVNTGEGGWMTTKGFTFNISAASEQLDLMQNWGFNSLRITMSVELWLNNIDNNRANLRSVITQAQERGIYVTLAPWSILYSGNPSGEWQSNALPYPPYQGDQSYRTLTATEAVMPNKQAFIDFYGALVNALKDYPNVLWEVWNEPHADVYAGEAARADFFANVVNPIISNARNDGAQQPFVIDGNWGGINATDYLPYLASIPDSNIALSFHLYTHFGHLDIWGNPTDYAGIVDAFNASGVIAASEIYPIDFAEVGITVGSSSELTQYDNILHIFSDRGWSWGAWWFRDDNIFAFVDSKADPTTEGLVYQKWLQTTPSAPSTTPAPPDSPTPTATPSPTPTIIPSPTPTITPTPSPSPTATPIPTLPMTDTPTPTPTVTPSPTTIPSTPPTPTHTPNPTTTSTPKPTPTPTTQPTPQPTTTAPPTPNQTDTSNPNMPNTTVTYIAGLVTPTIIAVAVGLSLVAKKGKNSSPLTK